MNCNVEKHLTYHQQTSRLFSSESIECPGSIFDYHSPRLSVELDDHCSDSIDLDETATNMVSGEVNTCSVIRDEAEVSWTDTVKASQSCEVTASAAVSVNGHSVAAPLGASKLPQSWSALPTSSLRMPSRLPHSRAATTTSAATSANHHHASKSDQRGSGLTLTSAPAVSYAGVSAGSRVGPNRFH